MKRTPFFGCFGFLLGRFLFATSFALVGFNFVAFGQDSAETESAAEGISPQTGVKYIAPRTKDDSWHWTDPVFGRYQIQVGGFSPDFDDGIKYYEDLYGKPTKYGFIGSDFSPWAWFIHPSFGIRAAYFTDSGRAAKDVDASTGEVTKDENGKTALTLVPFQFLLGLRATPFPGKWLVGHVYLGRERMYFQEVRRGGGSASMINAPHSGISGDGALTNKGWLSGNVTGASVSVLLNPLDERSVRSMAGSTGLGFVYLSLFHEKVTYIDRSRVSWGRSSTGIGFSFESIR
ncbi:MAG: hypothetical protein RIQ81_1204 [Pseudomonadota bacterium]|jgi:hypothetical protein